MPRQPPPAPRVEKKPESKNVDDILKPPGRDSRPERVSIVFWKQQGLYLDKMLVDVICWEQVYIWGSSGNELGSFVNAWSVVA